MHVVATAGHVDHGKSTLVRALTGMEPDRLAEEARRGLTLDLGFAWTTLPTLPTLPTPPTPPTPPGSELGGSQVAFVDVPGHARFVTTMLAGVGPVPVVLLVVAADAGWMPQSSEHLDALDALGVDRGLLVLTRIDLADEAQLAATRSQALAHLAPTSLAGIAVVTVSAKTGEGLDDLRVALARVLGDVAAPDPQGPVRLWVDRSFSITGAGTVVTGTLPAGRITVGDELAVGAAGHPVAVRALQALGEPVHEVAGLARVAVNLRGVPTSALGRGDTLTTPGSFWPTAEVDVLLRPVDPDCRELHEHLVLHLGSSAVRARVRVLGPQSAGPTVPARLRLDAPLALRIGDVGLLRDPGAHRIVAGLRVLDVAPPALVRRGAAAARAAVLQHLPAVPDAGGELARRGLVRAGDLVRFGAPAAEVEALTTGPQPAVAADGWLLAHQRGRNLAHQLTGEVAASAAQHPLQPGLAIEEARQRLDLPTTGLVRALVLAAGPPLAEREPPLAEREPPLAVRDGRVVAAADARPGGASLPPALVRAAGTLLAELDAAPFAAPDADRLRALGLSTSELAALVRAQVLVRLAPGVYLPPASVERAAASLTHLPQPFTAGEARGAWATSRRVALPLLDLLDRRGATRRLADDRRIVTRTMAQDARGDVDGRA